MSSLPPEIKGRIGGVVERSAADIEIDLAATFGRLVLERLGFVIVGSATRQTLTAARATWTVVTGLTTLAGVLTGGADGRHATSIAILRFTAQFNQRTLHPAASRITRIAVFSTTVLFRRAHAG